MSTVTAAIAVRRAAMRDIPNILALINAYAAQGVMLPRTEFEMSENIRDFSVAYEDGRIFSTGWASVRWSWASCC